MRILHVLPGFQLEYPGGITNYARTLIKQQISEGHQVGVVTPSKTKPKELRGITLISVKHNRLTNFSHNLSKGKTDSDPIIEKIKEFIPDVLHFHMVFGLSLNFLEWIRESGIPYFISLHDYYLICPRVFMLDKDSEPCRSVNYSKCRSCNGALEQFDIFRVLAKKINFRLPTIKSNGSEHRAEKIAPFINGASGLMAVSTRTAEIFREKYPLAKYLIRQIGNFTADSLIPKKVEYTKVRITFIGTLSKHKGGDLLIEILDYLEKINHNLEFHFFGKLEEPYDQLIKQKAIINHGKYSPDDIPRIVQNTDIGMALPIWEDNGPQVVMEMINLGTPVFATRVGGIPDFVTSESGYLFHPDSAIERERAYGWLANLTKEKVKDLQLGTRKLNTPAAHAEQLFNDYKNAI